MNPIDWIRRIKERLHQSQAAYATVFDSEPGKRVLEDLFHLCHAQHTTYAGDVNAALIAEGKRQIWIHIMTMLSLSPDDVSRLAHEIKARSQHAA